METTELDLDAQGGELLASAAYLALLAYPESIEKRDRSVAAMLALLNRAARNMGKPTSPIASSLFEEVPRQKQARTLGTGRKGMLPRIYRRLKAAEVASMLLACGDSVSLNDMADGQGFERSYFLHTVWAESKPVLHLALALRGILLRWQDDGRPAYLQLLARLTWVREAMRSAESWRVTLSVGDRMQSGPEFVRHLDVEAFIRLIPLRFDNHH